MDTANMFRQITRTQMIEIHAAGLILVFQNPMTTDAADISAHSVRAFEYQLFQPTAKPIASST